MRKITIICLGLCSLLAASFPEEEQNVRIDLIRDSWGIPHVFADSDHAALFGLGYATAEDRLFQMEYSRRVIQGRLAEMVGEIGPRGKSTLDSDKKNRHIQIYPHCQAVAASLDSETKAMLDAYCQGVNHYLEKNKNSLHSTFQKYGIVPDPWTPADCLACWERVATFFSPNWTYKAQRLHQYESYLAKGYTPEEAAEAVAGTRIIDEAAAVVQEEDFDPDLREELESYAQQHGYKAGDIKMSLAFDDGLAPTPKFSHAWVIGGGRTTTGAAVLNSDPQTAVRNPSVWYEYHIQGASFNARGIGIAGCPGLLIGWNSGVAWGVTALGADMNDLFRLEIDPQDPGRYRYDSSYQTIESKQEIISARNGRDIVITVKSCALGPVVTPLVADVRNGEEYVLKTPALAEKNAHTVQALIAMLGTEDVHALADVLPGWISPGVHFLFGDSQGNIGYWTQAALPLRSPLAPLGGKGAQYGTGSQYDWVDIIPHRFMPHVINPASGVIFSGNHLPVGSWYPLPLQIGQGGSGDSQRSWRLRELLTAKETFSPVDMLKVHIDDVNAAIRVLLRAGYHVRETGGPLSREAESLLDILRYWYSQGAHCNSHAAYFAGAYHIRRLFREAQAGALHDIYGGGGGGLCYFLKTLESKLNHNPGYVLDPDERKYVDESLETGWNTAVQRYGPDPSSWKARFQDTTARHFVPYGSALEGFPSLDPALDFTSGVLPDPEGATIWSQKGNSYSQWVDLSDVDGSLAVLPVGNTERPDSPFYRVEQARWENGTWRPAPLSRAVVERIGSSRETIIYNLRKARKIIR